MPSKPTKVTKSSSTSGAQTGKAGRPAGGTPSGGKSARPTRAEQKRERLAAARAELARAQRRAVMRRVWIGVGVAVAAVALVLVDIFVLNHAKKASSATAAQSAAAAASANAGAAASAAPGRTSPPPWSVPTDASAAVAAAGLPMLGSEGTAMHIHAHLDVIVNGQAVAVPADIGIDGAANKISPLHTHDTTGVIHVESPTQQDFTLGQFFREWQVALGSGQVGGLKADATHQLVVYVNGKATTGDPNAIVLHAHDEIAIVYGTAAQQANHPSTYQFAAGL